MTSRRVGVEPSSRPHGWNPLTGFSLAASAWILALGINQWWCSCLLIALGLAASFCGPRGGATVLGAVGLSIPIFASMVIVHSPHGHIPWWGPLTRDGMWLATELGLRYFALMITFLAAAAATTVPQLAKALQQAGVNPRITYVVCAALQLFPEGQATVQRVREAHILAGRQVRGIRSIPRIALPTMSQLIARGSERGIALEMTGLQRPGPRTLLVPVPDSPLQKYVRRLLPAFALALVLGVALW
ncbi:ABC transporter permease [Corynebacterium sp. 3HC-13]|uniref:energy-coupling factor transporter transmembrane component T family protein n=1 Tax=Corynebacterium poyangense TaxID=2684405 RepID=UPI00165D22FC|nr:energy-coupling factor transporter transmembrane component T [Corynebacterium poyangense]MBZ8177496.1 ABC transporter permease [Corynebacterium poyangense]